MMPLGAPSISKYGSLVRPDAQIVALRAHCARTALKAPPLSQASSQSDRNTQFGFFVTGRRGPKQWGDLTPGTKQ